ncbi:lipid II flippase MurJ [Granulicella mallensis]|uniref:Putative peptidoglycan lipid II flippase n=1 Tax=Granulicella mallensis TaxID=940614 RepID=A0A7W7ZNZ4_9BACT|nr:lipid II flippase MurJ [Granulicella mallensis]MBB5063412.1 putative peptidoglycan lipid II flippase [Granulicella mallensis]
MTTPTGDTRPANQSVSKSHTVGSAALLLMISALLSGLLGLVRIKYINSLFGAGPEQDAYRAAFALPDLLAYFLIGGAASISLITILNRYRESGLNGQPDDEGADHALSVILSTMLVVLGIGVLLAEIFAPQYVWLANKGFRHDVLRSSLCTSMTRIILPAQIFFFIGSAMGSRLQVRKIFIYQAFAPLIYNGGIILGAFLFHRWLGVTSLAVGVFGGMFIGYGLLNSIGAFRTGLRYRFVVGFRDPAFLEWLKLSLPLMIGVSLVMFDRQFLNYFASTREGGITFIGNAKDLFNAPFNVIGPAAGAASLPFFASLFQQKRAWDFSSSVGRAVSRLFAVGMLVSAWMIALAPWLMDLFRGGRFKHADAAATTHLFVILSFTLSIWAIQGIYARAFYAASDTKTPAIIGTVITVLSIPIYWALFNGMGLVGLAVASDIGILAQTISLAILLHKKRLVSLAHLEFGELGRALLAAAIALAATGEAVQHMPPVSTHKGDVLVIAAGSIVWAVVTGLVLIATKSALPAQILRRRKT